ncbi:uncharacterized protein [Ptychodera flava]|uniref:uncharacterized protein isoform X1 n=1 Tax=Ptychodera flava TaxID=63121 RepID=UPI003969BEF7
MSVLQDVFQSILDRLTNGIPERDRVRITPESPSLPYQIWLPFSPVQELTVNRVLGEIERVLQSYEEFTPDENIYINFIHVHMPQWVGKDWRRRPVNIARRLRLMRSVIRIANTDELCCARAIVTAIAHINRNSDPEWDSVRRGQQAQTRRAAELITQAGIPPGPCGNEELDKLQAAVPLYRIHVISDEKSGTFIYQGRDTAEPNIYLYHHDNHYDVVTSMPAFLKKAHYCHNCNTAYEYKHEHVCEVFCKYCRTPSICPPTDDKIYCKDCHRYFLGQQCFNNHNATSGHAVNTVCQVIRRCKLCGVTINWEKRSKKKKHRCGEKYCRSANNTKTVTTCVLSSLFARKRRRRLVQWITVMIRVMCSTSKSKKMMKKIVKKK